MLEYGTYDSMRYRKDKISITDFGGVGDGRTLNTKAFQEAIYRIQHLKRRGGTFLYIPRGVYLTGSFNLTSHMTLFLAKGLLLKLQRYKILIQTSYLKLQVSKLHAIVFTMFSWYLDYLLYQ